MDIIIKVAVTAAVAYFAGAIPFGYLIARLRGVDIFEHGSGNIGATNVGRVLGWRFGILVFALDFTKGALPAAAGLTAGNQLEFHPPVALGVMAGLGAFVGHLFPVYLGFRGGKGVATGAGVVAVLLPLPTLAALAAWIVVAVTFRYISAASIAAALVLCATHFAIADEPLGRQGLILSLFCLVTVALVIVKHRGNLTRLARGTENRLPDKPIMRLLTKTIHVMAVGCWFGMALFFSFPVALSLFGSFEALAESANRPSWFPQPAEYKLDNDMQKDQGTRAAGFAVSALFGHYFLWQGICALLATVTAVGWARSEPGRRVHSIRALVLLLGLTTVVIGWPIERTVSDLRQNRSAKSDAVLHTFTEHGSQSKEVEQARLEAKAARTEFGQWHLWSLLLNMVTIVLVTIAMALTAQLPPTFIPSRGTADSPPAPQ